MLTKDRTNEPDETAARAAQPVATTAESGAVLRLVTPHPGLGTLTLALVASLLGVVAGVGALGFRTLIALCHNAFFLGQLSITYDANVHTAPSPWGVGFAVVPSIGALGVVFLVKNFAPEARGHGVPEVMDAIYYQKSVIRPVVALVKSLASALSIGSGGSVGREGPIIQIGASVASWVGRRLGVSRWQLATLVAAGGGAGIAATFNTPIGGVLFAVEVLLHEVSVRTLVPVALATATATYVGHFLFGDHPAFSIPALHMPAATTATLLPAYVGLGVVMALMSVTFIRTLYAAEDFFERVIPKREYLRHVVGMLVMGALAETLMLVRGHYYVEGVGYATIMDILSGALASIPFLLVLFVAKLLATSLTLGSGASGGVFSPALFMGATVGGAYGLALRWLLPGLHVDPAAVALAGMAGLVAGSTGAALTAIVMIFEMTLDYSIVLPMTLTVAVAYGLRRMLFAESIYTLKLARRGHPMPWALQANAYLVHHIADIVIDPVRVLDAAAPPARLQPDDPDDPHEAGHAKAEKRSTVLVADGEVKGVVSYAWSLGHREEIARATSLVELSRRDYVVVVSSMAIFEVLGRMRARRAVVAVVVRPPEDPAAAEEPVLGLVTLAHLAEALAEGMEMFAD